MHVLLAIDFPVRLKTRPPMFIYEIFIHFISITLDSINESNVILFTLGFFILLLAQAIKRKWLCFVCCY